MALFTLRPQPRSHRLLEVLFVKVDPPLPWPLQPLLSVASPGGGRQAGTCRRLGTLQGQGLWAPRSLPKPPAPLHSEGVQVPGHVLLLDACPSPPRPHADPASKWLQRPLHRFPSVPSSQGTYSGPHGQFIYRALIFPRVAQGSALAFQADRPGLGPQWHPALTSPFTSPGLISPAWTWRGLWALWARG